MGRKNARAGRKRLNRRSDGPKPAPYRPTHRPRPVVTDIVRPVGYCGKKLKFDTADNAATALQQARRAHKGTGYIEKRYYNCDHCDGYHLTSREHWNPPPEKETPS